MAAPYKGSCHCGAVTYEVRGEPLTCYVCHCKQCQQQSSSAFGMSLRIRKADFHLLSGTLGIKEYVTDSGRTKMGAFCPECGSRIYHDAAASPDTMNIKPGTLDEGGQFTPIAHIWVKSKMPWVKIPEGVPAYDTQPDNFGDLLKAWAKEDG